MNQLQFTFHPTPEKSGWVQSKSDPDMWEFWTKNGRLLHTVTADEMEKRKETAAKTPPPF